MTKNYTIFGIYKHLINNNLFLFFQNICLEAVLPPMEIWLFTKISKTLLKDIESNKMKVMNPKNQKYITFLVFLQYLYEYNRTVINKLNKPIRLYVRDILFKIKNDDQNMAIDVVFMPLAIQNGYYYVLKYVLPIVVLFVYMLSFVCKYNKDVTVISIIYVGCSILYTVLQTIWLSTEAKQMFLRHGKAIHSYEEEDELSQIKINEDDYEEMRFKFNQGVNKFIFFQIIFYYIYCIVIVYVFAKRKHCELSSIITMLLFVARYYNSILLRSKMFIESVARLRVLRERLINYKKDI